MIEPKPLNSGTSVFCDVDGIAVDLSIGGSLLDNNAGLLVGAIGLSLFGFGVNDAGLLAADGALASTVLVFEKTEDRAGVVGFSKGGFGLSSTDFMNGDAGLSGPGPFSVDADVFFSYAAIIEAADPGSAFGFGF